MHLCIALAPNFDETDVKTDNYEKKAKKIRFYQTKPNLHTPISFLKTKLWIVFESKLLIPKINSEASRIVSETNLQGNGVGVIVSKKIIDN